jgi:ribonuclease HI
VGWTRYAFKGNKVYARTDEQGGLVDEEGLVEIRYRPTDGRTYRVPRRSLSPLDTAAAGGLSSAPRRDARAVSGRRAPEGVVVAYTDGACTGNPGPAGWGAVLRFGGHVRELSGHLGHATNNIAELWAIKAALQAIRDRTRPVRVMTDSTYALGVLTLGWKAKANAALVEEVRDLLAAFADVRVQKVEGHAGDPDNERADELAREAAAGR